MTWEEKIESLVRLAKAVERNYAASETDDWQEQKAASKGMFDAYVSFYEWGHEQSIEEILREFLKHRVDDFYRRSKR